MGQEGLGVPRVPGGPGGRFHLGGHSPLPRRGVRAGLCPPARAAQRGLDFPVLQGRLWVQGVHPPPLDRPRQAVQAALPLLGSRASLGPLSVLGAQADPEDQLPHRCHPCLASQVAPGGQGGPEVPLSCAHPRWALQCWRWAEARRGRGCLLGSSPRCPGFHGGSAGDQHPAPQGKAGYGTRRFPGTPWPWG